MILPAPDLFTSSAPPRYPGKTLILGRPETAHLLYAPIEPPADDETSDNDLYTVETTAGLRRYPRVSAALDGIAQPWLARWVAKLEHEGFRAAAVETLASTALGDGPLVARDAAAAAMSNLRPVLASEKIKMNAATFGTKLHGLIESFLNGEPKLTADHDLAVAFGHWQRWWVASGFTVVKTEGRVSCPFCGYGGTADALARDRDGRLVLMDWKSSRRLRDSYIMQVGAYVHATPERPDYALVVKIPHTPRAKVQAPRYEGTELADAFAAFKAALTLYRWTRRAAGEDAGDDPLDGACR